MEKHRTQPIWADAAPNFPKFNSDKIEGLIHPFQTLLKIIFLNPIISLHQILYPLYPNYGCLNPHGF